jgi:hypothetical protein
MVDCFWRDDDAEEICLFLGFMVALLPSGMIQAFCERLV